MEEASFCSVPVTTRYKDTNEGVGDDENDAVPDEEDAVEDAEDMNDADNTDE